MLLTDAPVRNIKHSGNLQGDKQSDAQALYLLIKPAGKYWRMRCRPSGKRKTPAPDVFSAVTLASARERRDDAHALLAN